MRTILCRLAVWCLLVLQATAFSTHLRQSNVPTHTEAKLESASNALPTSRLAEFLSIIRIRASTYLDLWRSLLTRSEARIRTINNTSSHQNGFFLSTRSAISLYASHLRSRCLQVLSSDATRFLVAMTFVVVLLGACICFLPSEETVSPRTLHELYETHTCIGSWARAYKNADGKDKQALEMLFRCHVIPQEEFRHSSIRQQHIEECIWIGRNMLKERPLEEWLERCSEAQLKFEESLNACSEEKWKARSDGQSALDFTLGSPGHHGQDVPRSSSQRRPPSPYTPHSPFTPQYDIFARDTSAAGFSPEHAAILKSPDARHRLLLRCTEIMNEYDRERRTARRALTPPASSPYISPAPTTSDLSRLQIPPTNQWASAPPGTLNQNIYPQSARNEESSSSDANRHTNGAIL